MVQKLRLLLLCISTFSVVFSQGKDALTPEEKAYFFHIVRKSPILEQNIGRYLEYSGPDIRFSNNEINYDSIELVIMNTPELLFIRNSEIAKSPKGILAEAANKMALWELNKVLLAKRLGEKELENYQNKYTVFETYLLAELPPAALENKNGEISIRSKVDNLFNPSLSFDDKKNMVGSFHFLELDDQLKTIRAINTAVNAYVKERTAFFFSALGGYASVFENILVAAGDGSSTSGLLEEREKDERGRWNKGLPKAVGFFPYQVTINPGSKKEKPFLDPLRFASTDFLTAGNNELTNIHLDVWGYNAEKQTTVVIEKNGLSYHLFGSGDTRFLSPDSTFSKGKTFQTIINQLQHEKIDVLYENIYGKKGYDYWIEVYKDKERDKKLDIDKLEKSLSDWRQNPITTKKKGKKTKSGYQVQTVNGKKNRKEKQESLVRYYNDLTAIQKKIKELEKEKEEAIDLLARYQLRIDTYRRNMGLNWATYTVKDNVYTFQDSSRFDMLTQEFQFPPSLDTIPFEIRLLAIPYTATGDEADEVMLHIHLCDAKANYDNRVQIELNDVFASDSWELNSNLIQASDSVSMRQFFEALLDKKLDFSIVCRGNGIGKQDGALLHKDYAAVELKSYPGKTDDERIQARQSDAFKKLRSSNLSIRLDREIKLEVNSFTDPVQSNLTLTNPEFVESMKKYGWSKNDLLSAYRSALILKTFRDEMNVLAGMYLSREEAKQVIDRFNTAYSKTKVTIGKNSLKIASFF